MSIVLLMVIIMRRISSLARTSFTRTSSLSARSFTVMPSASVMVRVIGGGAEGAEGIDGDDGRSRRVPVDANRGTILSAGRPLSEWRSRPLSRGRRPPGRATLVVVCAPAATAADADPPTCPESSDAPASTAAEALPGTAGSSRRRSACRCTALRVWLLPREAPAVARCAAASPAAALPARAGARVAVFARALRCGAGSSAERIVPPGADGGAADAAAATGVGGSSIGSSTTGSSSIWGGSGTITAGGASSMTTGGGGSTSITGGGAATTAAGASTGCVLDVRRRWRSGIGCRGLRGCDAA